MDSENPQAFYCEDDGEFRVYCDTCDRLCKERFYKNHLKSQTHTNKIREKTLYKQIRVTIVMFVIKQLNLYQKVIISNLFHIYIQYEKCFRINHTIKNPNFFDVDKISNDYTTNHNKKFELFLVGVDFKLYFDWFIPNIQSYFHFNFSIFNLKQYLLYWINHFLERVDKFSHIIEMNNKTISDKINISYKYYMKQPKRMVETKLNQILASKPDLINHLNRNISHSLIRKSSHIPFNNY